MKVEALDHINIRTGDVAGTVAFFEEILDMKATPPPGQDTIDMAAWILDDAGRAVIHVAPVSAPYPSDQDFPFRETDHSGPIHHVALRCQDADAVRERLNRAGLGFRENRVDAINLSQIFVQERNGILLELNFQDTP